MQGNAIFLSRLTTVLSYVEATYVLRSIHPCDGVPAVTRILAFEEEVPVTTSFAEASVPVPSPRKRRRRVGPRPRPVTERRLGMSSALALMPGQVYMPHLSTDGRLVDDDFAGDFRMEVTCGGYMGVARCMPDPRNVGEENADPNWVEDILLEAIELRARRVQESLRTGGTFEEADLIEMDPDAAWEGVFNPEGESKNYSRVLFQEDFIVLRSQRGTYHAGSIDDEEFRALAVSVAGRKSGEIAYLSVG